MEKILEAVKHNWIALLLAGASLAGGYAVRGQQVVEQQKQLDEIKPRIETLETNQITPREYQELLNRLDRIETKVDHLGELNAFSKTRR